MKISEEEEKKTFQIKFKLKNAYICCWENENGGHIKAVPLYKPMFVT